MEVILDVVVSVLGVLVVGQYTFVGRGHFSSDRMPRGAHLISIVILITAFLFLYLTWTEEQPLVTRLIGLLLQGFGWWLFWQTITASREGGLRFAFDEQGPRSSSRAAPTATCVTLLRVVHHVLGGWAVGLWNIIAFFPLAILIVIYVFAARMEEGLFAGTPMAAEYEAYKRSTGFFFPRLSRS